MQNLFNCNIIWSYTAPHCCINRRQYLLAVFLHLIFTNGSNIRNVEIPSAIKRIFGIHSSSALVIFRCNGFSFASILASSMELILPYPLFPCTNRYNLLQFLSRSTSTISRKKPSLQCQASHKFAAFYPEQISCICILCSRILEHKEH